MYDLDKESFGKFLASLRKEKGLTQRQLAQKLFVSDKAVSTWERGLSIPDTALLIPLADLLGVTVTELLLCRRCPPAQPITPDTVEQVVKTAITYPDQKAQRAFQVGGRWKILWFLAALAAGAAGLYGCRHLGGWTESLSVSYMLAAVFGAYFWLLVPMRLPDFYDQHRISFFYDMTVQMNIPGVALNNRNWPAIVACIRVWACLLTAFLPLLHLAAALLAPASWLAFLDTADLILLLGGLFIPLYIVGKK